MRVLSNVYTVTPSTSLRRVYQYGSWSQSSTNLVGDPVCSKYLEKSDTVRSVRSTDGWRPPLPYHVLDTEESPWTGEFWRWSNGPNYLVQTFQAPHVSSSGVALARYPYVIPTVSSAQIARAELKALQKLKDMKVNAAVAVAESRMALSMIGNNLLSLALAMTYAKSGQWQKAATQLGVSRHSFRKSVGNFAGRWLELQYGWLPLYSDIYGAHEEARRQTLARDARISVKATERKKIRYSRSAVVSGIPAQANITDDTMALVRLDYSVDAPALRSASQVGLTNPLEVAWELVPFSFILDWFIPVGNWISSFDAAMGLTFIGGSLSKVSFTEQNAVVQSGDLSTMSKFNSSGYRYTASASYKSKLFDRTVYNSTPWPLPRFKNPVSTLHAANALALFTQAYYRKA